MISAQEQKQTINDWVNLYTDNLYTWAFYKVSHRETAEDLVQETFLAAFSSIETFKGNSSAKTWLQSILNRKIIDYYRKCARSVIDLETKEDQQAGHYFDELFTPAHGWKNESPRDVWPEEQELLDNPGFVSTLNVCMGKLPGNWQASISAKYLLKKNSSEICQELNITATNYWQILHRAKLLLKKCLEANWFKI